VENENSKQNSGSVFSKAIRAGRRRTYFFDVKSTKSNDYYITITESKKKFNEEGYERHKIFLYKEDFNKFLEAMTETVNHVKTDLLPDYDYDEFSKNHDDFNGEREPYSKPAASEATDAPPAFPSPAPSDAPPPPPPSDDDLTL
jgi:hypothetical protein